MKKMIMVLCLVLALSLAACGNSTPVANEADTTNTSGAIDPEKMQNDTAETNVSVGEPAANAASIINSVLPERETVQEAAVLLERFFSGEIYAVANEDEKNAILDELYEADFSGLQDAELTGIMGASVSFKIRSGTEEKMVQIISDGNAQYLILRNESQQVSKKGSIDTFDFEKLSQLVSTVLGNEEDPNYSGRVEIVDTGYNAKVNKGNAAFAKYYLDDAIIKAETAEQEGVCDILFTIGDVSYGIDSDKGYFFRQESDKKEYAQLEEQQFMQTLTRLGVCV